MTDVGVSDMAIYIPPLYVSHEELASARGVPKEKYQVGLGNQRMSVLPNWEDAVTMAANAGSQLLEKTGTHPEEIRQLVVCTESGVDQSKPIASFVQGLLRIGTHCRVYEIKHACYGGTAGLVNSIDWVARNHSFPKKALVIMTDVAQYGLGSPGEPTQGAGAVALLVESNPSLLSIDTSQNGIYSKDVFDFWRPTGHRFPVVDGKYSIACYLAALEGAVSHFRLNDGLGREKLLEAVDYFVYHTPFSNMARKAHRRLVEIEKGGLAPATLQYLFEETYRHKVEPGLLGAREVGNIYTGSVYMGLISLLETERERIEGKRVGVFSYGSGCGAEFFVCQMKTGIKRIIEGLRFREQLERRKRITFEQYERLYSGNWEDTLHHCLDTEEFKNPFSRFTFVGCEGQKRQYQ